MTLTLNGHSFRYELENLVKAFFPLTRLEVVTDGGSEDPGAVETALAEDGDVFSLSVKARYGGRELSRTAEVAKDRADADAECERLFGMMVFELLEELTGVSLPWGILTGVRPVKLATARLERGETAEEIAREMARRYRVSPEKAALMLRTAAVEREMLAPEDGKSFSLYLSVPFCPSRCRYCSFVSHSVERARKLIPGYVDTLCREIVRTGELVSELGLRLRTVYFGGGTPTVLSAEELSRLTGAVASSFDLSGCEEYTVEAGRPDTITEEKLEALKAAGVTRVSVNPQSFDDRILEAIGRRHTAAQALEAYRLVRSVGFDVVNMDLIAGLAGDTEEGFRRTLETALSLAPENLTVHTLSVKRSSDLYRDEESLQMLRENPTAAMTAAAGRMLGEAGYRPYYLYRQKNTLQNLENVGYSKPGFEGRYNVYIMEEIHTILALGAGAVTKLVDRESNLIRRVFNYKYPYEYIGSFDEMLRRKERIKEFYG